jgi:hypothetical protein
MTAQHTKLPKKLKNRTTQRGIQITLGLLWLLDGALQLQRQMFTSNFANQVIAPAAQGQPRFVSEPMNFGIHLLLTHPAIFDALAAVTQLAIGALILWKRTVRWGLLLSIPWGFIVWIFGEGYGGIFSSHTLLLMGAPGAVIIYILLALAVMPQKDDSKEHHKKPQIAYWLAIVWLVLWVGGGVYQLLPGQNSTSDVSAMIAANADGAPGWLSSLDTHLANDIKNLGATRTQPETASQMHMTSQQMAGMSSPAPTVTKSDPGYLYILLFAALYMCIGAGVLKSGLIRNLSIGLGIIFSLVFWVVGQSMGAYFTGLATDPNSGPLFVLLGLAILGVTDLDKKLSKLGNKIEEVMIGKSTDIQS